MNASHRLIVGGCMLACVVLIVIGGELRSSVSSDVHTRERIYATCPAEVSAAGECGFVYENVVTGSRPNHAPAVLAFVLGAAAGLLGLILATSQDSAVTVASSDPSR